MRQVTTREKMAQYFFYLDELRESGETNMYGAPAYLRAVFDMPSDEAQRVFRAWGKACQSGLVFSRRRAARAALAEALKAPSKK